MTPTNQIKTIAELDGWTIVEDNAKHPILTEGKWTFKGRTVPSYLTSRDAIVPVIEKLWTENNSDPKYKGVILNGIIFGEELSKLIQKETGHYDLEPNVWSIILGVLTTPSQLCEALLRATGKWKE